MSFRGSPSHNFFADTKKRNIRQEDQTNKKQQEETPMRTQSPEQLLAEAALLRKQPASSVAVLPSPRNVTLSPMALRLEIQKKELEYEIGLMELRYKQLQEEALVRRRDGVSMSHSMPAGADTLLRQQRYEDTVRAMPNLRNTNPFLSLSDRQDLLRSTQLGLEGVGDDTTQALLQSRRREQDLRRTEALLFEQLRQERARRSLLLEERSHRANTDIRQEPRMVARRATKQTRSLEDVWEEEPLDQKMGRVKKPKTGSPVADGQGSDGNKKSISFPLANPKDRDFVSPYQAIVRECLEFFQTGPGDVFSNIHGRNNEIRIGQIGVRCKYCAHRPVHWRGRGCLYFPSRVSGVYQAAQNVANNHLADSCPDVPKDVKEQLDQLRGRSSAKRGGGKKYWEDTCRSLGLYEREGEPGLWLQ